MAIKDRLLRAHRMTVPLTKTPEPPYTETSIVTVSPVLWERDGDNRPVTRVPDDAVYTHDGKVVTKGDGGLFHYEDGTPLKGLVIIVNGDVTPSRSETENMEKPLLVRKNSENYLIRISSARPSLAALGRPRCVICQLSEARSAKRI